MNVRQEEVTQDIMYRTHLTYGDPKSVAR